MSPLLVFRASAAVVACVAATAFASPARAEPGDQIPGDGLFLVGTDILPGTYRTEGPSNPLILVFGRVSELSTCSWTTYRTPAASPGDIVDTNTSMGPMSVVIPPTVAAFQTMNCKVWIRVS
ncbi:hypothetical protein H7H78_07530 [Mycobacterium shinjukuense]|uniref:Uncharacterized protein n=1 Tax=Mycobacterium shinjukuense TaxID=398694 RepID=A0A7I7MKD5_9MYCO|nr:hypothetical protein [Mycobacterium shinjukuense]MCV6985286.1 hypothetical protein [Mycobacterium shinjukuense]ORB64953.1 hypothetical protein BST45_15705 [Mycobacterium shinjukuense]BBX72668.1 hypothetical protein MSHI_05740 [Mycobacterium shinjukuense]